MAWRWSSSTRRETRNCIHCSLLSHSKSMCVSTVKIFIWFKEWAWQINWLAPPIVGQLYQNQGDICLFMSLGYICYKEVRHFGFSGHFGHIPHFYFDVLVPGLSSDQLQLLGMSSQEDGHENYLKDRFSVTPCDRGVASKFDYTPWKHEVLYLGNYPNYTCTRKSQRPLVETGSDMFYTLMNCSWLLYNMQLKRPQSSHLIMVTIVTFPQTV